MKAILWDMDGSLINSEPLWEIATYDTSEFLGRRVPPHLRAKCVGNTLRGTLSILAQWAGQTLDDELFASASEFLESRYLQLVAESGVQWRPGVTGILDEAHRADIPVVLVTNTRRHITDACIQAMGAEHFVASVCSDEVAAGKPAPDPYLRGAQLAGYSAEQCLAIEDSPTGVRAAVAAGCHVVWNPMPEVGVSAQDRDLLVPPAHYVSGNFDTVDLALLRAAFTGKLPTWNNRAGEEL